MTNSDRVTHTFGDISKAQDNWGRAGNINILTDSDNKDGSLSMYLQDVKVGQDYKSVENQIYTKFGPEIFATILPIHKQTDSKSAANSFTLLTFNFS